MAYNEKIADRIRDAIADRGGIEEKKMFRGMCFMLNGKMCICVNDDEIMCRVDPAVYETLLEKNGVRAMVHNGRTMKGFVFVSQDVIKTKKEFDYWVQLSLEFNKKAKPAKKRKKS
jgi:TfoX/Sxy family transcriptional regulator of competence genes